MPTDREILIVEDDEELGASMAETLAASGYRVSRSADGREALERLSAGARPDAILLDLMMPGMDGWEFRALQKQDPELASTPVVVVSAATLPQARAIDADAFLPKPFGRDALLGSIEEAIAVVERRRAEEKLGHTDRLASLGVLAAGLVHEVRNPLAALLMNLQIVESAPSGTPIDEDLRDRISDARLAAEHIDRLMHDVASFARPDASSDVADMQKSMESALSLVGAQLRSVARLERRLESTPAVPGPAGQLVQVFVNLLVNAAHAIGPYRRGVIRTTTRTGDAGEAIAEVTDSGCGIPPDRIGRIFDPFYSTKPPGQGTGLGLSISHRFVTQIGGRIEVESKPGRTTFRVLVPAADSGRGEA